MKILTTLLFLFFISESNAHRGRLASDGCHYCRNNCSSYGHTKGTRHGHRGQKCNNLKGPTDPLYLAKNKLGLKLKVYKRKRFGSWLDQDSDCKNTRVELLERRSLSIPIFQGKCRVVHGKWRDFYSGLYINNSSDIEIDHVVPLENAWRTGANKWSREKRLKFANDPDNLVITTVRTNRKKSNLSPLDFSISNNEIYCSTIRKWLTIKAKYNLRINPKIRLKYIETGCDYSSLVLSFLDS